MTELSRRSILQMSAALPVLVVVAGCTMQIDPAASPVATSPSPTPTPSETIPPIEDVAVEPPPAGPVSAAAPVAVPSFGPNGTHYPAELPWLGETAATEVEVDCSWPAITDAIRGLTASQVAAGAVVRVRPGTLVGDGDKSSSGPVLSGIGDAAWSKNVLVCPRDGFGSVVVAEKGFRLDKCNRLSFFGFSSSDVGLVLTECSFIQIGWGRWSSMNITRGATGIDLYEVVLGFRQNPEDTFGIRPTDQHKMVDIRRFGCAFGPSVKPAGSDAHCDSMQLEGTGTGTFGPINSYDCVDYGSSNAAVLLHTAITRADFEHCMVLGEQLPWQVYPLKAGDYQGNPNALAGGALDVRIKDSIIAGPIGRVGFTHVENTILSYSPAEKQKPSVSGGWTVDPSVSTWTKDDIYARTGTDYSTESLAKFWRW